MVIFFIKSEKGIKFATEYGTIKEIYIDDNDEVKYDIAIPSAYNEVISVSELVLKLMKDLLKMENLLTKDYIR